MPLIEEQIKSCREKRFLPTLEGFVLAARSEDRIASRSVLLRYLYVAKLAKSFSISVDLCLDLAKIVSSRAQSRFATGCSQPVANLEWCCARAFPPQEPGKRSSDRRIHINDSNPRREETK